MASRQGLDNPSPCLPFPMIVSDKPGEVDGLRNAMNAKVWREMPAEKARAAQEQTRIAQKLQAQGSVRINGLGQKMGSIDRRTYFRHQQENPGCWSDPGYAEQLLRDSPKLRAPGYQPKVARKATYTLVYK